MTKWLPIAAGILAVFFWAISFVAIKIALPQMRPVTMIFLRQLLGTITVVIVVGLHGRWELPSRSDLPRILFTSFVGIGLHQWLQAQGMLTTTAISTSWLSALAPILIALMSWIWLRETFVPIQGVWLLIAGIGAVLVASGSWQSLFQGSFGDIGALLVLASAFVWALYSILLKQLLYKIKSDTVTLTVLLLGLLMVLPIFVYSEGWMDVYDISLSGWVSVIVLGVGSTGLASILYNYALKNISGTVVASLQYPEPLITVAIATWLLQETFTFSMGVGGLLILLGIWCIQRANVRSSNQKFQF
jgi:drug/metabolite transporter (DMT)-like permease